MVIGTKADQRLGPGPALVDSIGIDASGAGSPGDRRGSGAEDGVRGGAAARGAGASRFTCTEEMGYSRALGQVGG